MSATCPACGVAVVPGYAKCPKCHKPLPVSGGRRPRTAVAGGTVAEDRRFPFALVLVPIGAVVVIVVLLKLISGGGDKPEEQPVAVAGPTAPQAGPAPTTTAAPIEPPRGTPKVQPQTPDPNAAANELDRALRGRRLWSTVETSAPRIDVRSGSCDDPNMGSTIDTVAPVLRSAGLTRLRCLAQSGTVVFERDL